MIDLPFLISALTPIREWFQLLKANRMLEDEAYQEALKSLYTALMETRIYLGTLTHFTRINSGQSPVRLRNREEEAKLSRLWTDASLKLRNFDHDLAERCFSKGDYWANPEQWSQSDIRKARIQIDKVFQEARQLL